MAAAAFWVRGGKGSVPDVDDENANAISAWLAQDGEDKSEICPEIAPDEVDAVALFIALDTQWNWHPMAGVRTGINYAAVPPTAQLSDIKLTPALFADIRQMEAAAMHEMSKDA